MVVLGIEGIFGQAAKAAMSGKRRVQWDTDSERKLIEIWEDILGRYNGKMMTRKLKEEMATKQLNDYVNKELGRAGEYTRSEVHNKIDSLTKKGGYSTNSTKRREKRERKLTTTTLTLTLRLPL